MQQLSIPSATPPSSVIKNPLSFLSHTHQLATSLSFYKIQYHLLKKKLSNLSTLTYSKNLAALEETLRLTQKQLVESEAFQNYLQGK
jgi:hypothetical protein